MLIEDRKALADLVGELRRAGRFALDTEFVRERTYRPRLCLLQVAVGDRCAIVDPLAVGDLGPFLDLISDPGVEKVVHAGEQDLEIFYATGHRLPRNVIDTQVAAALVGRGEQPSYGRLVEDLCGVRLAKHETFTDWCRRPLTEAQTAYALDDVRHLLPMMDALREELAELGRLQWLSDELRFYEHETTYRKEPEALLWKVRGAGKLDAQGLAVLRELAAWREAEAERIDMPRARVISDEPLVEIARRAPRTREALRGVRGIHPRLLDRSGAEILRRVSTGLEVPASERPDPPDRSWETPEILATADLLEVVLRTRALECRVAPSYLASRRDVIELVGRELQRLGKPGSGEGAGAPPPLLSGWRRRLVGDLLLELLRGERHVAFDPGSFRVRVVDRPPAS